MNEVYDEFVGQHGPLNKERIRYRRPSVVEQESGEAPPVVSCVLRGICKVGATRSAGED